MFHKTLLFCFSFSTSSSVYQIKIFTIASIKKTIKKTPLCQKVLNFDTMVFSKSLKFWCFLNSIPVACWNSSTVGEFFQQLAGILRS